MRSGFRIGYLCFFLVLGCTTGQNSFSEISANRPQSVGAQSIFLKGDPRIGMYISSEKGFETNTYWIEGPSGLILIDTQFLLSAGLEAVELAEKSTGKKVQLAIVLHANPDKFNGVANLKKRGIRVVTSEQVRQLIPSVHKLRHGWFYERFKPDYPDSVELPESFGNQTTTLTAGGITVTAHVLGAGCSLAHVVIEFEKNLFVGDLVSNGNHSWLELGLTNEWLDRIDDLWDLKPERLYIGRGFPGGPELLIRQDAYLNTVNQLVKSAHPHGPTSQKKSDAIMRALKTKYPGYGYELFAQNGLEAIWKRLAK